ncbi:MAG: hypothetical protein EBT79_07605 [Actinobacteria bacterium]|nr:hypothetical protein [Actinomycetota bacterium]NBR67125.1 hypothetical protein [Actinomycetota bacterium]
MVIIGIVGLRITRKYLNRYLRWATTYACDQIPDGFHPSGELGVVGADGSLLVVVPLVDDRGEWIATGIGPRCHADGWASDAGSVN